jgi:hypothetical protein
VVLALIFSATVFVVMMFMYGLALEDQYWGLLGSEGGKEIIERAKRDAIFVR